MGRVGRPHGTDGGFTVADATERAELLDPGRRVMVAGRDLGIVARRGTGAHPIVVLEGIDDRTAAEALRGEAIFVPRSAIGQLAQGEYLVDELIGFEVADGAQSVGRVKDVLILPSADALEVERPGQEPLLVPLVGDAVRRLDTEARRVDVDMGFLEPE